MSAGAFITFEEQLWIDNGIAAYNIPASNQLDGTYSGYMYSSDSNLRAICCPYLSITNSAIQTPNSIPYSLLTSAKPQYTFGIQSKSGKNWLLQGPLLYSFLVYDYYLYVLPMNVTDFSSIFTIPGLVDLNQVGNLINFVDPFNGNQTDGLCELSCSKAYYNGICASFFLLFNNGTNTTFDNTQTPTKDLVTNILRLNVSEVPK
eukprot:Pgem_evm1s10624